MNVAKQLYTIFREFIIEEVIKMTRGQTTIFVLTNNRADRKKLLNFQAIFEKEGISCLESQIEKLEEPCLIKTMKYCEDNTNEMRNVNCIQIGISNKACICFYR